MWKEDNTTAFAWSDMKTMKNLGTEIQNQDLHTKQGY
jgi:hypothetical protein